MKYRLVIFDFDGTLCDNRLDVINSIQATYTRLKHLVKEPPGTERINQALSQGAINSHLFKLLNPEIDKSIEQELISDYKRASLDFTHKKTLLFPGVIALFDQLKRMDNLPCVIVSNRSIQDLHQAVEVSGLNSYITHIIGVKPNHFVKPDPRLYEQSIKPHFPNIHPNEILVVGDTITDLLFAKAIKADACWVSYGHGDAKACQALIPQYIVNEVTELNAILIKEYRPSAYFAP